MSKILKGLVLLFLLAGCDSPKQVTVNHVNQSSIGDNKTNITSGYTAWSCYDCPDHYWSCVLVPAFGGTPNECECDVDHDACIATNIRPLIEKDKVKCKESVIDGSKCQICSNGYGKTITKICENSPRFGERPIDD